MKRWARMALLVAVVGSTAVGAQPSPMRRPVAPYVVSGCPFECCRYGAWRFALPVALRTRPRADAPITARVPARARVRGDSGHVRVTTIGRVAADRDFVDPDGGGRYIGGDTILVLDYLGEGFFHVWVRGERRQLLLADVLSGFGPPVPNEARALRELEAPVSEWWVHVTAPPAKRGGAARRGWVLVTDDLDIRGADSCGGPDAAIREMSS